MESILADVDKLILPGITHWNAPGFMAYFGITGSGPAILGEMLSSALNVNAMLWQTSPAATELEQVTLDWLRQMLGLPACFFGVLHDSSSGGGAISALAAAREAIPDLHIREQGMTGRPELPPLRFYASQEAHSSIEKAGIILGIGQAGLRKIGVDSAFRLDVAELEHAIQEDLAAGWHPFAVVATVGTTSATSVDPVAQIAGVCERYGLWLHVDAAYGGAAAVVPQMRWVLAGCERAHSLSLNPYKWLFTTLGGSVLFTRRPEQVKAAFSLVPEYLRTPEHDEQENVINFMDYGAALSHRFLALKLWITLRYFGQEGLATRIREHIRLAQCLAQWIDTSPDFERLAPTPFSVVCFRAHPKGTNDEELLEALNKGLMRCLNAGGRFFLSHTRLNGMYTIRIAIGNLGSTEQLIQRLWTELQATLDTLKDMRSVIHIV
jgi:aromatic-L-amino-acid decarboxylase